MLRSHQPHCLQSRLPRQQRNINRKWRLSTSILVNTLGSDPKASERDKWKHNKVSFPFISLFDHLRPKLLTIASYARRWEKIIAVSWIFSTTRNTEKHFNLWEQDQTPACLEQCLSEVLTLETTEVSVQNRCCHLDASHFTICIHMDFLVFCMKLQQCKTKYF